MNQGERKKQTTCADYRIYYVINSTGDVYFAEFLHSLFADK